MTKPPIPTENSNKTNYSISSNSPPSATANKAIEWGISACKVSNAERIYFF